MSFKKKGMSCYNGYLVDKSVVIIIIMMEFSIKLINVEKLEISRANSQMMIISMVSDILLKITIQRVKVIVAGLLHSSIIVSLAAAATAVELLITMLVAILICHFISLVKDHC